MLKTSSVKTEEIKCEESISLPEIAQETSAESEANGKSHEESNSKPNVEENNTKASSNSTANNKRLKLSVLPEHNGNN